MSLVSLRDGLGGGFGDGAAGVADGIEEEGEGVVVGSDGRLRIGSRSRCGHRRSQYGGALRRGGWSAWPVGEWAGRGALQDAAVVFGEGDEEVGDVFEGLLPVTVRTRWFGRVCWRGRGRRILRGCAFCGNGSRWNNAAGAGGDACLGDFWQGRGRACCGTRGRRPRRGEWGRRR